MSQSAGPSVVAVVGPTCTGKTDLSLALAEELGGEIIACDSRTIYRCFDIGTAKPSQAEMARIRHHLVDVADPDQDFTAANFKELGRRAIDEMASRGSLPIVCGGTGFYARALLEGLQMPSVPPQEEIRRELNSIWQREGPAALYERLAELDPVSARRLNPNDRFRIVRALEVTLVTGVPFSQAASIETLPYRVLWIGLAISDREFHRQLIERRLLEQLEAGLLEETRRLYQRFGASAKLMNTVNYRDLVKFIEGRLTLEQALASCVCHNYLLARKQMIWFKANKQMNWLEVDKIDRTKLYREALHLVRDFLGRSAG